MYQQFQTFLKTTIIGGIVVMLPMILLVKIVLWLGMFLQQQLLPITDLLQEGLSLPHHLSDFISFTIVVSFCFFVGLFARYKYSAIVWTEIEKFTLAKFPGYNLLKSVVDTFSGSGKQSFSRAVLVRPWGEETYLTGFITDTADNGYVAVFVPTSPTPTTGLVMHVPKDRVIEIPEHTGLAFKTVLSCGAGALPMLSKIPPLKT